LYIPQTAQLSCLLYPARNIPPFIPVGIAPSSLAEIRRARAIEKRQQLVGKQESYDVREQHRSAHPSSCQPWPAPSIPPLMAGKKAPGFPRVDLDRQGRGSGPNPRGRAQRRGQVASVARPASVLAGAGTEKIGGPDGNISSSSNASPDATHRGLERHSGGWGRGRDTHS